MRYLLVATLLIMFGVSFAAILTVDNHTPSIGQYQSLTSAYNAAQDNDIIYLYPSQISYEDITISKPITIYGPGWTKINSSTIIPSANLNSITFATGAENTAVHGITVSGICNINCINITIRNCHYKTSSRIYISSSNCNIDSCLLQSKVDVNNNYSNIVFSRNIVSHLVDMKANTTSFFYNNIFTVYTADQPSYISVPISAGATLSRNTHGMIHPASPTTTFEHSLVYSWVGTQSATHYHHSTLQKGTQWDAQPWVDDFNRQNTQEYYVGSWIENVTAGDFHIRDVPLQPVTEYIWQLNAQGVLEMLSVNDNTPPDDGAYSGNDPFDDNYNIPNLPTILQMTIQNNVIPRNQQLELEINALMKN